MTRFCGVCGLACLEKPPTPPPPPPDCPKPGAGKPVDLLTGQELLRTGGMSCAGHSPIETGRNYNPIDAFGNIGGTEGSIGYGWALDHDIMLLAKPGRARLVMPGNVQQIFAAEADGSLRNRTESAYDGAVFKEVDGLWRLLFKDGTRWTFQSFAGAPGNVRGQPQFLTEILSPSGAKVTVARNSRGQLLSVGTEQRRITASYGSSGFIESLSDPEGRAERYAYSATKRLSTVTDPDGRVTRYGYVKDAEIPGDAACRQVLPVETGERLSSIQYPGLMHPTQNVYGSSRRVLRQVSNGGAREYKFSYRVSGACVTHINSPGQVCQGAHCPNDDNSANFDAGWRFHGGQVLQTRVTRPDGTTQLVRFGSLGQVLEMSDSAGEQTRWTRDNQNRRTKVTDAIGRSTRMQYDELGNVTRRTDALGRHTDTTFDPLWNKPASVTRYLEDGTAQTWRMGYDGKGNLAKVTDPLGHVNSVGYNAQGQVNLVTDALNQSSSIGYNAAGDVTQVTDALGHVTRMTTDRAGRPLSSTDPLNYTSSSQSNGIGQTTETEDALGGKTTLAYDDGARLKSVTNPLGKAVASYGYDEFGRRVSRTDANGGVERYAYDSADRLSELTDRKGQVTRLRYDEAGRVVSSAGLDQTTLNSYDAAGRLVRVEKTGTSNSRIDFEYDAADRLVKETQTFEGRSQVLSYGYDSLDRRISRKLDDADEVRYDYDLANRLVAIQYAGKSTRYDWDTAGRLVKKTLPNGITADYGFDAANRLLAIEYKKPGGAQIEKITYAYDAKGQRTAKTLMAGSMATETAMTAEYDATDRMTSINLRPGKPNADACSLTYDLNGNLSEKNCTAAGITRYTWDAQNRMVAVSGSGLEAAFAYDALGRRASRTINGLTTSYSYDGSQAIAETRAGIKTSLLTGLAVDELIASYTSGQQRVMLTDALGSVLAETKPDGSTATSLSYSAYGETKTAGDAASTASAYTGREQDQGNLYYYRARFYDAELKRFLGEDPIGLSGGLNQGAYVGGDPVSLADPLGECPWCIGAAFGFGFDLISQLLENGGDWRCIDLTQLAMSTAMGALGGGLGGKGLSNAAKGLSKKTKGNIGEGLSMVENRLKGSSMIEAQTRSIPGQKTIVDSTWRSGSGSTYYVESKFGTSGLTKAQRAAANAVGDAYRVERWGYPFVERVGAYPGGALGGVAGHRAGGGQDCECN